MKRIYITLICCAAALPFVVGFSSPEFLSHGIQAFGNKLETVMEKPGENLIFSPWNIATLLALTGEGAEGETQKAFWDLLEFPAKGVPEAFKEKIEKFEQKGLFKLESAIGLWLQTGLMFNPLFQKVAVENFEGQLEQVSFKENPEKGRTEINHFVSQKTHGKIYELIKKGGIKKETEVVLVSALYMNAPFLKLFSINHSREDTFTPKNGTPFSITFIHHEDSYGYYEDSEVQIVEIPYKSSPLEVVLWVALPKGEFFPLSIEKYDPLLTTARVDLKLPRMEIRSTFDLKEPLAKLGFTLPFSVNADFKPMVNGPIKLSTIIHEAYLAWDERGTEAAAASSTIFVKSVQIPQEVIPFHANRPFSFLIWEKTSGIPLFQGQVASPTPWRGREILEKNDIVD